MRVGVDLGGTKIEVAALSDNGFVLRERCPTPKDYDGTLAAVSELIGMVDDRIGWSNHVGVGIPGAISRQTGMVRNANALFLNGRPFEQDLQAVLGRSVTVANDADCFALSEAGGISGIVFGAILGTGCGGGVVVNGALLPGDAVGEWGHNALPWPVSDELEAPDCWCGRRGCIETWVSGTGFARDYQLRTGKALEPTEIVRGARSGFREEAAAFDRYVDRLGRALASVVNVICPDEIVLGGGMSNVDELYDRLPATVRSHVFSPEWEGRIRKARFGDSSGVRGAAHLL